MVGHVYINCELYQCRGGLEAFVERVWFQAGTCAGMFFYLFFYLVSLLPFSLSDMAAFLYVGSGVRKDQKTVPSTTAVDTKPQDIEPPQSSSEYRQRLRPKIHSGTWLPQ